MVVNVFEFVKKKSEKSTWSRFKFFTKRTIAQEVKASSLDWAYPFPLLYKEGLYLEKRIEKPAQLAASMKIFKNREKSHVFAKSRLLL